MHKQCNNGSEFIAMTIRRPANSTGVEILNIEVNARWEHASARNCKTNF